MAADDSCGPAIDFDNTGCLRISGASLFLFPAFPSVPSFLLFRLLSRCPSLRSSCCLCRFPFRPRPWRFASVCCLFAVVFRCSDPSLQSSFDIWHGCISASCKKRQRRPVRGRLWSKGRSATVYSAASGRITTFTRLLSSRIFWASFCTSAFETVRMACSPLAT